MKALARLFSALTLLFLLAAAWLMLAPQPQRPSPPPATPLTGPVDHIVIHKSARRMTAFRDGQPLKTYPIALGFAPHGDKRRQGDGRTPEGRFTINRVNPRSAYHLSLGLDYPRPQDRARAAAEGTDPGGDIFIHGQPNTRPDGETLPGDWTAGCIAVSDSDIRELHAAARIGTTVEILP
ncbi:L,D-transpeptidase family protein [Paracoccus sp. YIM 132242]|uniref:L,D-transpeptidase family protein n=1 Tax=Paracoccus lichenicola TaxID=2665644 RepID=A0A6L6HRM2_9RHOB|nr:L,D-transpeptidase [Paracoccus lichenicola]MTE01001.1 L,D-transpeptidase family protein [Paracoccus lichenicola]